MVKGWDMVNLLSSDRDYFYLKVGILEKHLKSESFLNFMMILCDNNLLTTFQKQVDVINGKIYHGFIFNSTSMRYFSLQERTNLVMSLQRVICDIPDEDYIILYKEDTCELY